MRRVLLSCLLVAAPAFAAGCGGGSPQAPGNGSSAGDTITGRERIGWDQPAGDVAELATFRYAIYVDNARSELADTSCATTPAPSGFACSARLPTLSAGAHTLELAAFITDGSVIESARSSALRVTVAALTSPAAASLDWQSGVIDATADGLQLRVDRIAGDLDEPVDAAFTPDGRLFIAERTGRVRIVDRDRLQTIPALTLQDADPDGREAVLSLAVDPDFARTHFVYVIQTARSASGLVANLARYRELGGRLAQRAILYHGSTRTNPGHGSPQADTTHGSTRANTDEVEVDRGAQPAAVLRFGPDGKLYLALDGVMFDGTLLRLNGDGTMPRDQAGTTPAIAGGIRSPRGMGWHPRSGVLWIADDNVTDDRGALSAITTDGPPIRASVRARYALDADGGSLAFYHGEALPGMRGDAVMASVQGRHILRVRFAPDDPLRITSTERLLQDRVGAIRLVLTGPDGAIYFCTATELGKLGNP